MMLHNQIMLICTKFRNRGHWTIYKRTRILATERYVKEFLGEYVRYCLRYYIRYEYI